MLQNRWILIICLQFWRISYKITCQIKYGQSSRKAVTQNYRAFEMVASCRSIRSGNMHYGAYCNAYFFAIKDTSEWIKTGVIADITMKRILRRLLIIYE